MDTNSPPKFKPSRPTFLHLIKGLMNRLIFTLKLCFLCQIVKTCSCSHIFNAFIDLIFLFFYFFCTSRHMWRGIVSLKITFVLNSPKEGQGKPSRVSMTHGLVNGDYFNYYYYYYYFFIYFFVKLVLLNTFFNDGFNGFWLFFKERGLNDNVF